MIRGGLWSFWDMHGHTLEGRTWLARALDLSGSVPPSVRANALNGAGMLIWYLGDYEAARLRMTEALEIRRVLGDKFGLAISLNNLGMVAWSLGDYASALI